MGSGFGLGIRGWLEGGDGVFWRLQGQRNARPTSEQNALVLVQKDIDEKVDDFWEQQGITVTRKDSRKKKELNHRSFYQGFVKGLAIDIFERID